VLTVPVLAILACTTSLAAYWSHRFLKKLPWLFRAFFLLASVGLAGVLFHLIGVTAFSPNDHWNGARLAALIAAVRGIPLYGNPKTGILSAWIYGPLPVLAYLPTSLLHRPTGCIMLGVALSEFMVLTPAMSIVVIASRRSTVAAAFIGPIMLALAFCLIIRTHSLVWATTFIASDAPAIGSVLMACLLLMGRRGPRAVAGSALFTVLACWCKQTFVPFVIVPPIFLLLVESRKAASAYGRGLILYGTLITAALVWKFGATNMWFNMVTVPSRQPFQNANLGVFGALSCGFRDYLFEAIGPAVPLAAAVIVAALLRNSDSIGRPPRPRFREWCGRRPWVVLLFASFALLPTGVLGYIKVSGGDNNFAIALLCLLLAGTVALIDFFPDLMYARPWAANLVACTACTFIFLSGATADATQPWGLKTLTQYIRTPSRNAQEIIFHLEQTNPGIVYFPWDPLAPLLVEGKLYHFEWGFVDRIDARLLPSPRQVTAHVPANMRWIALPVDENRTSLDFFPAFKREDRLDFMPNYIFYGP
jgi:hypothetical protein